MHAPQKSIHTGRSRLLAARSLVAPPRWATGLFALGLCAVLCASPAHAQRGRGDIAIILDIDEPEVVAEPRFAALPDAARWFELVARDARLSFTGRTSGAARAVLDAPASTVERRAIAMIALGCAGTVVERKTLERAARDGSELERRAAILALGEMSAGETAEFEEWVTRGEPQYAECALLAMLRSDRRAERRRVEEIAADSTHPMSAMASDLLVFHLSPSTSKPTRAAVLLLRLRFEAARSHGLVDGENWRLATIRKLAEDREFARDVVLFASSRLRLPAARDHVFAALVASQGRARLHAAARLMPAELSDLVDNALWLPKDVKDWRDLLAEIDAARLERLTLPVIRAAIEVPEVRYQAVALASLAGDEDLSPLIGLDTTKLSPEERVSVCLAIGARSDPGWLERFALLGEDTDPKVRAAYLIARFRQRQRDALEAVHAAVADINSPWHVDLIEAACAAVHDPAVAVLLEDRFLDAQGDEKTLLATTLCLEGRLVGRARVRDALSTEPPPDGPEAARQVRALRLNATAEDIGVLKSLFPSVEGDRDLDRELVLALLERSEPDVFPILRAALWDMDFDISMLAAGVLANVTGVRALVAELRVPPDEATSGDLRRIGFAIGEWGGIAAIEALARELRWASGHPALQGALLGALSTRTQ
ncbi:MAG: hypothetical protein JNL28_03125 [Planctomycetes bacterium]|nr:hypothetical protein [Planctomycetota bacterium]